MKKINVLMIVFLVLICNNSSYGKDKQSITLGGVHISPLKDNFFSANGVSASSAFYSTNSHFKFYQEINYAIFKDKNENYNINNYYNNEVQYIEGKLISLSLGGDYYFWDKKTIAPYIGINGELLFSFIYPLNFKKFKTDFDGLLILDFQLCSGVAIPINKHFEINADVRIPFVTNGSSKSYNFSFIKTLLGISLIF